MREMSQFHLVRVMRERIARLGNKPPCASSRMASGAPSAGEPWVRPWELRPGLIRAGHQSGEMVGIYARNMPVDPGRSRHPGRPRRQRAHLPHQHPSISCATSSRMPASGCCSWGAAGQFDRALHLIDSGEISHIVALDGTVDLRGCASASHFQAFLVSAATHPASRCCGSASATTAWTTLLTLITSGTTGEPKGSCSTFANMAACFEMHDRRPRPE